ncbi:hypothetical protein BSKO_09705 [Bryopsis sp. KO-2023]|nr:hypothetical protein BSKO_09705 [Bryopsis sp. KO-2023]
MGDVQNLSFTSHSQDSSSDASHSQESSSDDDGVLVGRNSIDTHWRKVTTVHMPFENKICSHPFPQPPNQRLVGELGGGCEDARGGECSQPNGDQPRDDWMRRQGLSSEGNYLVRPGWAISFLTWVDSNKKREAQQRREDQETEQPSSGEVERSLKKNLTDLSHLSNGKRIARTDLKHEVEEITPEDVRVLDYLIDVEAFEFDAYEVVESLLREVEVSVEEPLHPSSGIEEHPAIDRHEIGKNDFKGYCAALNNLQRLQQMLLGATLEPPLSSDATFTSWRKRWCADVAHRLME